MRTALVLIVSLFLPALRQQPDDPAALFDRGATWEQFLAGVKSQRETWVRNAARTDIPPELVERLKRVADHLRLIVVTEDWCADSVHTLPYVARLASLAGVEVRIVDSKIGRPLMTAHQTPGHRAATPTIVFLREGHDVDAWVERPSVLQTWFLDMAGKPASLERASRKASWYEWDRGDTTLAEVVAIAEQSASKK